MNHAYNSVKNALLVYPSLFDEPADVMNHMFLVNGNGWDWSEDGRLVSIDHRTEYQPSEQIPLWNKKAEFNAQNIDLIMQDLGRCPMNKVAFWLTHVYIGHSDFELTPVNATGGWDELAGAMYTAIKTFVAPQIHNERYFPYQFAKAKQILANFEKSAFFIEVLQPRRAKANEWLHDILKKAGL